MSEPAYTIQRFRGGWAVVVGRGAGRKRYSLAAPDRLGAEAEARQRWRLGQRGPWPVGRIIPAYIDAREAAGIATTSRQRDAWKALAPYWADIVPAMIDDAMCQAYARRRARAAATVRYELNLVSIALRWAVKEKLIDAAPAIWRPAPPEHKLRHLTREEFGKFLDATISPHARLFLMLGIATCARPTALLELTWSQVDFARGMIDLNPPGRAQNAKRRPPVPIADWIAPVLQEAYAARLCDNVIERAGKPIKSIKKAFVAATERSGIKATPYTLRHTAAVWRAEEGVSMPELAQLMGHEDSVTTERHYARFSPQFLRKAANAGRW